MELVLVPPGLLHSLSPLPPKAKLLKVILLVTIVTHKSLSPRLRLRLELWSLWWRLRLGGLGFSLGIGLGCPRKGVKVVLKTIWLGSPNGCLWRFLGGS